MNTLIRWIAIVCFVLAGREQALAKPKIRLFQAERQTLAPGQSTTLRWEVAGAATVRLEPDVCTAQAKGSCRVTPEIETTYRLIAADNANRTDTAEVRVRVELNPNGPSEQGMGIGRVMGRTYLMDGESESPGFGLYSYVLFGAPPGNNTQARALYLEVLRAVLAKVPELDALRDIPLPRINAVHIPVKKKPGDDDPAKVLEVYDYARALKILMAISDKSHRGPYLISLFRPINIQKELVRPYLLEDLTRAPQGVVPGWVGYFLRQGAQPEPWNPSRLELVAKNLRIELERLSATVTNFAVILVP